MKRNMVSLLLVRMFTMDKAILENIFKTMALFGTQKIDGGETFRDVIGVILKDVIRI